MRGLSTTLFFSFVLYLSFLFDAVIGGGIDGHGLLNRKRHAAVAAREGDEDSTAITSPASVDNTTSVMEKRMSDARFSYYVTGTGACGKYNHPGDPVSPHSSSVFFWLTLCRLLL
jgi:hypothetical protein